MQYILNDSHNVEIDGKVVMKNQAILDAIKFSNDAIFNLNSETKKFDINIFEALGMRNLSGLVGEYFAKSLTRFSEGNLESNLHQDGYPDLLLVDQDYKKEYLKTLYNIRNGKVYPINKLAFSPFKYGGIEVKSTCGSTPTAKEVPKPLIGEQRINILKSFDWKSHHRGTNNLLGLWWDFIDETPKIVACFYRNDLSTDDWGKVVQPKEDGGRTTSVSIMTAAGIKKMCSGWIAILDSQPYKQFLIKKTKKK